ncbi:MAG: hypothetical protein IEMM0002_1195 [bacterium]|nr:MAG: hypothetical protein IEMM0002_1195 [bacterium]
MADGQTVDQPRRTGLHGDIEDSEAILEKGEPWEAWETKLVLWSLGIGVTCLIVFGFIINTTILAK